jgi:hypothetical protein
MTPVGAEEGITGKTIKHHKKILKSAVYRAVSYPMYEQQFQIQIWLKTKLASCDITVIRYKSILLIFQACWEPGCRMALAQTKISGEELYKKIPYDSSVFFLYLILLPYL